MMPHIAIWRLIVLLLAIAPLAYYVMAIAAATRFFTKERKKTLADFRPSVSILKPVRGVDFATYENFRSFCLQDYENYEILFCVNEIPTRHTGHSATYCRVSPTAHSRALGSPQLGTNRKVNNLALLAKEAQHDFLVQSDGDVRVGPNYLREVLAPFADPSVGVVSCFYRAIAQPNLPAELEAVGTASDFFAGALVADWMEGVTFALGASVATRRVGWGKSVGTRGSRII